MAALIKIDHSFVSAAAANTVRFCSRCGEPAGDPPLADRPLTRPRVCDLCGMGMLLTCVREALPGSGAAFLIATAELRVTAVSEPAEDIFGAEQQLLGTGLQDVLTSPMGEDSLGRAVGRAALRNREPVVLPVRRARPAGGGEGILAARVSTCGPPRAALVTVEPSAFGRR